MRNKSIFYFLGSIILFMLLLTEWNFDNSKAFPSILTFLSIITGFSVTALSIIATSNFSKELYEMESKKNNSLTLLHELIQKFKTATLLFIGTIILILFYEFWPSLKSCVYSVLSYKISIETIIKSFIWYFTIFSFIKFIDLFLIFSRFVLKSVSKQNKA